MEANRNYWLDALSSSAPILPLPSLMSLENGHAWPLSTSEDCRIPWHSQGRAYSSSRFPRVALRYESENRIDAEDFVSEEIQRKVQFQVDHSSKTISDLEYDILVEGESALVHIEEINMVDAQ